MSVRGTVRRGNVRSGKCPFGEMSVRGNVRRGNVRRGIVSWGTVFGEMSVGEMSVGELSGYPHGDPPLSNLSKEKLYVCMMIYKFYIFLFLDVYTNRNKMPYVTQYGKTRPCDILI